VVDGLPVPAEPAPVPVMLRPTQVPAVQAAALAATGCVAGAATAAVVARRRARPARRRRKKGKGAIGEIVSSNSFLVDVHLVRRD
jgi:membrane protein YqaA with SNARE-associated domain